MSFGGFFQNTSSGGGRVLTDIPLTNNMPGGITKSMFSSPGLSLAIQRSKMEEENGDVSRFGDQIEPSYGGVRAREDDYESRSGSEAGSGDEQEGDKPPRKKRYHRHTPQQIQELEALFKECPHPDEKQRLELSRRLNLETRQVKFWFQNRRTQMKTQIERHENSMLRQENDKLRAENISMREAMRSPLCTNCGGPAVLGEMSGEEQQLRVENARLKEELERVCALSGKFIGRPLQPTGNGMPSSMGSSNLDLGMGMNGFGGLGNVNPNHLMSNDFNGSISNSLPMPPVQPQSRAAAGVTVLDRSLEKSMCLELALTAMEELVRMAQSNEPLWVPTGLVGQKEKLNVEEYARMFPSCIGPKPSGFASEATRESGVVIINSGTLVETLMDANRWVEMFPCMIARAVTTDVISNGMGGTRNGALQVMQAELQVLSPLVPVRRIKFLRFCKQHAEGVWAVVDVSPDFSPETPNPSPGSCRRLPSGCIVQDMPNGCSKVTWIEHAEYGEERIHRIYRPLLKTGMGFGAQRWLATLQRQCESVGVPMTKLTNEQGGMIGITPAGWKSMLKLAHRMTDNFCAGVCASTVHKWNMLGAGNVDEDVRVMTRKSIDNPGEPPGVVLSAATSVWLPASPQKIFDFLRDERLRSEWDILSNGGPMHLMTHIPKGRQDSGNSVSLLRANPMGGSQSSMLILQETCIDAAGALMVYAPVDLPAMNVVMRGGDSAYVALLPSGFSVVPDGMEIVDNGGGGGDGDTSGSGGGVTMLKPTGGSLLTVAFQILVNPLPTAKLTVESVDTVNNLISCTVQKIKTALT